ncbi:MAG: trigger factor, partial [Deltaproteobacteria bacterium]|nr:trigger factor [Deltaproteobacteria bacterium]
MPQPVAIGGFLFMNVVVNDLSSVKKELVFELGPERIAKKLEKSFVGWRKKAKIKGFRPGKAPLQLVRKLYHEQVRMEALEDLVQDAYSEALQEHKLVPLAPPAIADLDFPEDEARLSFKATVEVMPEFSLENWEDIELQKHAVAVGDDEVDAELEKLRQSMAQYKTIDERCSREGDTLVIDFQGRLDGVEFEGGSAADFTIELGSGRFIPDLERQLVGLEPGRSYDLEAVFPEDYHKADLAGKKTVFTVKVKSIREKELPALDDDLAIQISGGELETLAQLRDKMAQYVSSSKASGARNRNVEELLAGLRNKVAFELPECLVREEEERSLAALRSRFLSQGMEESLVEQMLSANRERVSADAAASVKNTIILEYLAERE